MQIFYQASDTAGGGESSKQIDPYEMTPDEIDNFINQSEVEPENEDLSPEEKDDELDLSEDTEKESELDSDTSKKIEKTPEVETEAEKTEPEKTDNEPLIDDKFISKYSKEEQDALRKYEGKPISELVKALANQNKVIGKKAEEVKRELFPSLDKQPITQESPAIVFPKDKRLEEVEKIKEDLIIKQVNGLRTQLGLSEDFPLPTTLDLKSPEYKEWLKTVSYDYPADLKIFDKTVESEKQQLDKAYTELSHYRENFKEINDKILNEEVGVINQYFGKAGLNLKELGVEFTDEVLEKMLYTEKNGEKVLDAKMFTWVNGEIPILKEGALAQKFMNTEGVTVLSKVKDVALTQGRKEAVTVEKKLPINKGLGNTDKSGEFKIKAVGSQDPYTMNAEQLDREIAAMLNEE
jgi:hypothetical protein